MKRHILGIGGLVALMATAGVVGVGAQGNPIPTPTPPGVGGHKGREKHPEMMRAMKALERAQKDLMAASHDYHGHRAKALELTNQAIAEVKAGIQSDRK